MTCEQAIDHLLENFYAHLEITPSQRHLLICDLIDRTSSPPLDDENSHSEWTSGIEQDLSWMESVTWNHTEALRSFRDTNSNLSENAKNNLESITHRIISNSFNPNGNEPEYHWRDRGWQCTKRQNNAYSTLIARSLDIGYKLIIVLSGRLDSLRKQTSSRLHAEIVNAAPRNVNIHHLTSMMTLFSFKIQVIFSIT